MAEPLTIVVRANGPYLIEGDVRIVDSEGREFARDERPRIALCRCGNSGNKPFCDGTHKRIEFHAEDVAPRAGTSDVAG
jgi:CDGSH-type Zn-finger protein